MKEYGEILLGLVLAALGVAGIVFLYKDVWTVIKGVIGIIVLMVGAVFLMIGISDVREKGEEEIEMGEVEVAAESGTEEEEKSE
ncbi:MAG: hypothetical protein WA977_13985 [Halobacteriota archaeon]